MTEQEARISIDKLVDLFGYPMDHGALKVIHKALEEVEQYRALGTVEELKEAMEKQVAKKPKIQKTDDKALFKCPCCDNVLLEEFYGVVTLKHGQITKHCEKCGQAIDESEME